MTISEVIESDLAGIPDAKLEPVGARISEIREGERLLGEAPPRARQLWALAEDYEIRSLKAKMEYLLAGTGAEAERVQAVGLHTRYIALEDIARSTAWAEIRESLGLWNEDGLGIRKGFVVVVAKSEERPNPLGGLAVPVAAGELVGVLKDAIGDMMRIRGARPGGAEKKPS